MKIVEKHALWLRLVHWFNVPLTLLMIWSGVLIYWANGVYPGFFPKAFYRTLDLQQKLAEGMAMHSLIAWLLIVNGIIYLCLLAASGHWREIFPNRKTPAQVVPTLLADLGLIEMPNTGDKFNAMQRLAYTGAIGLGVVAVLSGFAIYKPVQLEWLTDCFAGYEGARLTHFICMLGLSGFIAVHLVQVVRAGWNNFRAMVAGFEVEDER